MTKSWYRCVRTLVLLSAAITTQLAISGCGAGWGDSKPVISTSTGQSGSSAQTVNSGQSATFTVTPNGTGPFTFQWYKNGVAISGANGSSYTTPPTTGSDNGAVYTCSVTNAAGTVMSQPFTLAVDTPPSITTQPQSLAVTAGQPATFTVASGGTGPLSYQWYQNGTPIPGATSATLLIPATGVAQSGLDYTVTVTNALGNATSSAATLTVNPEASDLAFNPVAPDTYGTAPFPVSTTSASNGTITYSVVSGPAIVSGNTVTVTGTGTVVLQASQAASGNYAAATADTSFTVSPGNPNLAFSPVVNKAYGSAPFPVNATSASNGAITYSVLSGPATISGDTVTVTGPGTVVLQATQPATGDYIAATVDTSFTVSSGDPNLALAPIPNKTYGSAPFPVSATSASNGAITYSVVSGPATISGNMVTLTGLGPVVVQASQAATADYTSATTTTSFTVGGETPMLTFASIPAEIYGNAPFPVTASSASSGAVTYSVVSGPATIVGNTVTLTGAGPVEIMASQAASGDYTAATAVTTFTVAGETPTITFPSPGTQAYSQTPIAVNATSNSTGTITYSVVSGPATISGNMVTMTGAGPVTLQASEAASGGFGTGTATTTFTITATNPQIALQPVSQNLCPPQTLTLSVNATNATSYQWNYNGTPIPGATDTTYTIGSTSASNTGNYTVTVSNPTASVTSQTATVNVGSTIVTNPSNLTITQYQEGSFSVAATGSGHYTYQWWEVPFGGSAAQIPGATSSLYVTPPQTTVTPAGQPNSYYAVVTDTTCSQTLPPSGQATLTVDAGNSPPTITQQPLGQTVAVGSGATFTADAVGAGTITYQWYVIPNGGTNEEITGATPQTETAISGATSASYTVPTTSTQDANDQDVYYVVATNAYGTAVSQHATLAVDQGIQLQITNEPANQYVNAGESATFSVTATSTAPLTYQWYEVPPGKSAAAQSTYVLQGGTPTQTTGTANAVAIPGATGATLTVPNTTANQTGTVYYVVVSNGTGTGTSTVYSNTAVLTVGQPTGIGMCATDWNMLGSTTAAGCTYELTDGNGDEQGEIVWPTLISTGNVQLSFTITTSNTTTPPADGFTMTLGDSLGATLQSVGLPGEGIGAKGIPGFVLAFDDFYNAACTSGCYPAPYVADPSTSGNPDYLGVGRGEPSLWENPYFNVNLNLPIPSGDTLSLAEPGKTITHSYVVSMVNGYMSVTMDGTQVFSGNVSVPPVAYLYLTASTGGSAEEVQVSNISATVNAPSN